MYLKSFSTSHVLLFHTPDSISAMPKSQGVAQRKIYAQLTYFCLVGLAGTAVHYAVLLAMVQLVGVPVVASAMGFVLGASISFILSHRFIFVSAASYKETVLKFFGVTSAGLVLNVCIVTVCITMFKLHYLVAQIVATGIVLIWNFSGNRIWTFSKEKA